METSSIVGRVLNHDDTIPEKELKQYANDTQTRLKILRQENAKKNVFLNVLNSKKREDEAKLREESMNYMHFSLFVLFIDICV